MGESQTWSGFLSRFKGPPFNLSPSLYLSHSPRVGVGNGLVEKENENEKECENERESITRLLKAAFPGCRRKDTRRRLRGF
ncbi:MAG: hypothetical protein SynsKO_38880 [Synoicihabitans sp.]